MVLGLRGCSRYQISKLSSQLLDLVHESLKELFMVTNALPLIAYGLLNPVNVRWVHSGQIVLSGITKLADPKADTTKKRIRSKGV